MKNCTGRNCPIQMGMVDFVTCKAENCPWRTELITNADYIRAMTDEEWASFLALIELTHFPQRSITAKLEKSYDKWLDWLRQEAEE